MQTAPRFLWRPFLLVCAQALLLGLTGTGCSTGTATGTVSGGAPEEVSWLRDAGRELGFDFVHDTGPEDTYFMPALMAPGVALFDFDDDGDLDIYVTNAGAPTDGVESAEGRPPNRLYRQGPDGKFSEVTDSGLGDPGYGMGTAVGDIDNDGDLDLFVTNYGQNALYRNRGDGTFEDVTEASGVGEQRLWSASAAFLDYDADGWLDLFVTNYLYYDPKVECPGATGGPDFCNPNRFDGVPDTLLRNQGDGTFRDVSEESGVGLAEGEPGLGVVIGDFNLDDLVDVYVANDQQPNQMWINQGDGRFVDEAVGSGTAYNLSGNAESSMGVLCADLNGDALLDLFMTHLRSESNTAYSMGPNGIFNDATAQLGLLGSSVRLTGFGVVPIDLENDGDLDIAMVNGHVFRGEALPHADLGPFWNDYGQEGVVMVQEDGRFVDFKSHVGSFGTRPEIGRGLAAGDLDNDGDVDLVTGNTAAPARIFLNESPEKGHWLSLRVYDEELNRDVLGATVTVEAGGKRHFRVASPAYSYLSSNDLRVHVGLGAASSYDSIEVNWPGPLTERFPGGAADRQIRLVRGTGTAQ